MKLEQIYIGTVINNIDPLLQGRVQIFIENFMLGWIPALYPWAMPFSMSTGGSPLAGSQSIPEIGSKVFVSFEKEDLKRNCFYMADVNFGAFTPTLLVEASKLVVGSLSIYPDVKFTVLKNGTTFAMTSGATPEIWLSLINGAYIFLDSLGGVNLGTALGSITINAAGLIDISGNIISGVTEPAIKGATYAAALGVHNGVFSSFLGALTTYLIGIQPIADPGTPPGPKTGPLLTAITTLQGAIATYTTATTASLSTSVTHN